MVDYGRKVMRVRNTDSENAAPTFRYMYNFRFGHYKPNLYRSGGLFSSTKEPVEDVHFEHVITIDLLLGRLYHGGQTLEKKKTSIFDDYDTAADGLNWWNTIHLPDLSRLEIVDTNQWEGNTPIEHKASNGTVVWREPALWDIAAIDQSTGERHIFMRSHVSRDHVLGLQFQIQTLVDYSLRLLSGWEDQAAEYYNLDIGFVEDLPEEKRETAIEMCADINARMKDDPLPRALADLPDPPDS